MIKIIEDISSEMLEITNNGVVVFYGNYWDFSRDGEAFSKLFKKLNLEFEIERK